MRSGRQKACRERQRACRWQGRTRGATDAGPRQVEREVGTRRDEIDAEDRVDRRLDLELATRVDDAAAAAAERERVGQALQRRAAVRITAGAPGARCAQERRDAEG